jgi:hypothetical protein
VRSELQAAQEMAKSQRAEIEALQQKLAEASSNAQVSASQALTVKLEKELTGMLSTHLLLHPLGSHSL